MLLLAALGAAACAQDVGDVDRTQPNRLAKSIFEGEWYLQRTTFDVPYSAGFTFTGETSLLERVRWEIEEGWLIAYRTYDLVENTLEPTLLPGSDFRGAPVAAYAISSQFDITREYNALTGEETNVIQENTTDRPWYEREYIRVDWSKNLVANFNFLDDQVDQSPTAYYVQDRDDADRLLVGVKTPEGWVDSQDWDEIARLRSADYLDLVDTIFANPEAYEEVDEVGDLVSYPACWFYAASDCQPSRVKIRSSFLKIDPNESYETLPFPDNAIARQADGTPYRDAAGDPVRIPWFDKFGYFRVERDYYDRARERTETGRIYLINRWSIWEDAPACKQNGSYAGCTVKPIVYHLSPNFPEELADEAIASVDGWNRALKEVVNQLKYGGQRPLDQVEDVFILKRNTFAPGEIRGQRIGDLRYSFVYYVPEPLAVGPLGYGPSAADPLTGRIVSASAYVYGAGLESWAAWGADVVQLLNGAIAPDDFIEGEDVRAYVEAVRARDADTNDAVEGRGRERLARAREIAGSKRVLEGRAKQRALGKRGMRLDRSKIRAKLTAIEDTPIEERLLTDEIIRALKPKTRGAGDTLLASLSPEERRRLSPARWGSRGAMRARTDWRRLKIRKANLYLASFADDAVLGLAESLRGQPFESVRKTILGSVFRSTAEHEIGHTLGLRHNFAGSFDALNYKPEYWQLRGSSPVPFTEMTEEQKRGRMREYQYSTIMDYGARFNSDIHGLGHYDRAAILFGYGELIEVFQSPPAEPLAEFLGLELALHEMRHYTSYPRLFGGSAENMYSRRVVPYREVVQQMTGESPGQLVEVPYRFCSDEYEGAVPSCNTWDEGADPWEVVENAATSYENYYLFNSFSRDVREIEPWDHLDRLYWRYFIHAQVQYQDWVFRAFGFEPLWEELRQDADFYGIEDLPYDRAIDGNLSGALASAVGLDTLAKALQAPEPGAYYLDPDDRVYYNYSYDQDVPLCPPGQSDESCADLNIPLGTGKYAFSLYDGDSGYYFFDRVHVIGSFYDKLAALQAITSPETNFLGVDSDADLTSYAISMHLFFPDEVTRLVGGSAVEAYNAFGGVVRNQRFEYRDVFAPPAQYQGLPVVDPATSFTIELYAGWLGMAFLNANYDNSFNDGMRVFEEGSGEGFTLPADPERIARFVHPRSGRTFVAVRHEDPARFSPAFELLSAAQANADRFQDEPFLLDYYTETAVAIIEGLRGMYELYGKLYF